MAEAEEYFIISTAHEAIFPERVLLFYGPNRSGYSTDLKYAGRYSKAEAESICSHTRGTEYMALCSAVEAKAVTVVEGMYMLEFTGTEFPRPTKKRRK